MAAFDKAERTSFTASVDRFVAEQYDFTRYLALRAGPERYGRAEWARYAELGWLALLLPVEAGGLGGGAEEAAIVMEAIGRGLLLEPFLASIVLGGGLVARAGRPEQVADILPQLAAGTMILAFASLDAPGAASVAKVDLGVGGFRLTGRKDFVLHGDIATQMVVSARLGDDDRVRLFVVDPRENGVAVEQRRLIDGRGVARVSFSAAPAEALGEADATAVIQVVSDHAVAALCSEGVGAMGALNMMTLAYVKTRQQFGAPIGSFQVLQHRLVDMVVAEQQARSMTLAAARALDQSHPNAALIVSAAKVCVNGAARFIGEQAIQLHGGIGMTEELSVGHYFKRLLPVGSLFGDSDHHLDRIAGWGA